MVAISGPSRVTGAYQYLSRVRSMARWTSLVSSPQRTEISAAAGGAAWSGSSVVAGPRALVASL